MGLTRAYVCVRACACVRARTGVYYWPCPFPRRWDTVRYSGLQLDTASYVRIQLDKMGYSGTQWIRCIMARYTSIQGYTGYQGYGEI